jgi:hypothetical protein
MPSIDIDSLDKKHALMLGMIYTAKETKPHRGQYFRDKVRCKAMEESGGYNSYSLDDKHDIEGSNGKHCKANFADPRRMLASIKQCWGNISFDVIILDYFFSPVSFYLFIYLLYILKYNYN